DRQLKDANTKIPHLGAQRRLVEQHLDRLRAVGRRWAEDPQNPRLIAEQGAEGASDGQPYVRAAEIDGQIGAWRIGPFETRFRTIWSMKRDALRPDLGKELVGQGLIEG